MFFGNLANFYKKTSRYAEKITAIHDGAFIGAHLATFITECLTKSRKSNVFWLDFSQEMLPNLKILYRFGIMKEKKLIGRANEVTLLEACINSNRSEFAVIYGRRRIGKTFLVNQTFGDRFDFCYVGGHHLGESEQLQIFAEAIKKYGKASFLPKLSDWFAAFSNLQQILEASKSKKKIIFIDEMPWIDTPHSKFVKAFETFWNGWAALRDDIFLIASGSATSWMAENLFENQGGLYNRITAKIYLRPFTLSEVEEFCKNSGGNWDRYQITEAYMVFGGVPYYYSLIDFKKSLAQNIDSMFFNKGGQLTNEFNELYSALFNSADRYLAVVRLLASKPKGLTRDAILKASKIQGGLLTKILLNLERSDFIQGIAAFGKKKKGIVYRLTDFFSIFYFKYVEENRSRDSQFWTHSLNTPAINAWHGLTFETICLMHSEQIKKKLGISGMLTSESCFQNKNAQIDLIIDRADRIINICEIKFSTTLYPFSAKYAEKIRTRMAEFRAETGTRKGIVNTFITTYGILDANSSSLVNSEVVLDDLFK